MDKSFSLSFEFFPPKTPEAAEKLRQVRLELGKLKPQFFSVTFGAGGSTQDRTFETVQAIVAEATVAAAPHISCIGSTKTAIRALLQDYVKLGVKRIVALRGDLPSGMGSPGELRHANELVAFIREQTREHFHIEVAAYPEFHPQAVNAKKDLDYFKKKIDAGASSAITQYFYSADAYECFVEETKKMGVNVPIVPGIMPITNFSRLINFSDACGAEIPQWIRKRLAAFGDDTKSIVAFGEEVVTKLCQQLLSLRAPGLHFYTLNQTEPTRTICRNLSL